MGEIEEIVMRNIRGAFGYEEDDKSHDLEIVANHSTEELFEKWCNYEGLINYAHQLIHTLDSIRAAKKVA